MKHDTFTIKSTDQKEYKIQLSPREDGNFSLHQITEAIQAQHYAKSENVSIAILLGGQEQRVGKILTPENLKNIQFCIRENARLTYAPNHSINVHYLPDVTADDIKPEFLDIFAVPIENIQIAINSNAIDGSKRLSDVHATAKDIGAILSSNVTITPQQISSNSSASNTYVGQSADTVKYTLVINLLLPDKSTQQCTIDVQGADTIAAIKKQITKHVAYTVEQLSISTAPIARFPQELSDETMFQRAYELSSTEALVVSLKKSVKFMHDKGTHVARIIRARSQLSQSLLASNISTHTEASAYQYNANTANSSAMSNNYAWQVSMEVSIQESAGELTKRKETITNINYPEITNFSTVGTLMFEYSKNHGMSIYHYTWKVASFIAHDGIRMKGTELFDGRNWSNFQVALISNKIILVGDRYKEINIMRNTIQVPYSRTIDKLISEYCASNKLQSDHYIWKLNGTILSETDRAKKVGDIDDIDDMEKCIIKMEAKQGVKVMTGDPDCRLL